MDNLLKKSEPSALFNVRGSLYFLNVSRLLVSTDSRHADGTSVY